MKKTLKIVVIVGVVLSLLWVLKYFKDANASEIIDYETEKPFYTSIVKEVVATGKLNPEDEIELKPQVSGIIDKILVEEGDIVRRGDLIASIRVVPNEQAVIVLIVELIQQDCPIIIQKLYLKEVKSYLKRELFPNRILKIVSFQWSSPKKH